MIQHRRKMEETKEEIMAAEPQESRVMGEESAISDTIYDLASPEGFDGGEGRVESGENMEGGHNDCHNDCQNEGLPSESDTETAESASGAAVRMTAPHEETDKKTGPRKEIERMVEEMGAETLLEIIRDNRNAAIRQIISEVEASRQRELPSGASVARECSSIFDLAALA